MKKFGIIGEGTEFIDDWGVNSTDVGGVRINGNCVQRLSKSGTWYDCYNAGKPIEKLLWTENGSVMAVTQDGRAQYAANLACNPQNKPKVREYVLEDKSKVDNDTPKREAESRGSSSRSGWWWKWPLKGIWAAVKFIFWGMLFNSMSNSDLK